MKGRRGVDEGDMGLAAAIAVDKEMDLVYVTDLYKGKIVSDKLKCPIGVCLSDEFVFVSDADSESVVKLSKTGVYLNDTKTVNKDLTLSSCSNMCTYNNQTVYVCNNTDERIEVFILDLSYTGNFGEGEIHYPTDIKTHNDRIFVLDYAVNKIHTFNTEQIYLTSIQLVGYDPVLYRGYLTMDKKGNFIVSSRDDNFKDCLKVFSPSGELMESLGSGYLCDINGIGLDRQDRIISISHSLSNCFQVY